MKYIRSICIQHQDLFKLPYFLIMKKNLITQLSVLLLSVFVLVACSSKQKGDVSDDPKYADIANNIFFTKAPTYYYEYTQQKAGGKTGNFLSSQNGMPTAKLIAEIPVRSHVHISKVLEVPQEDGSVKVMVTGKVFPNPQSSGEEYMAILEDIKPALDLNK